MASYVVAASFFVIGTSYLVQFVIEPPGSSTSNLEHLELKSKGQQAMDVILGTPGLPANWNASPDTIKRLGLLEAGTSIRVNPDKFDALARGKFSTSSSSNGAVDYAELKTALALDGYEVHLRAYPVPSQAGSNYGMDGFEDYRVAYVGDVNGETFATTAQAEASALENLSITFLNKTRTTNTAGDVFQDDSVTLRNELMPSLGATIQQETISEGSGTKFDFYRVNKSSYQDLVPLNVSGAGLSRAMALSSDGTTLGYTKSRELRAIVGSANLSGATMASLHWHEWVDTDRGNGTYDCGDYGYAEVSPDNGTTWYKLTDTAAARSQDCNVLPGTTHAAQMVPGEATGADIIAACAACADKHLVLVAFHWIADNDNTVGYGWIIDNVRVHVGTTLLDQHSGMYKTFEAPDYNLLVVGSAADHMSFTPEEVKAGIRDYVNLYGGRIIVLGGQSNAQWLDRLFDAALGGGSGGLNVPDTTHPLLTLPNQLDYDAYTPATAWDFSSSDDAALFSMITGTDVDHHYLSVSRGGAWGSGGSNDGAVILTSYSPHRMSEDEARRFFANNIVYGRFHYLHLEVGPPVPSNEAVASVARSALMNKYRDGTENFTEMAFIMYVWPGTSAAATQAQYASNPGPVQGLSADATSSMVYLNWTRPSFIGTGTSGFVYEIWRGSSPSALTLYQTINATAFDASNHSFLDYNGTSGSPPLANAQTYWYNVTMSTNIGRGTAPSPVSATPFAYTDAPDLSADAVTTPMAIKLTWTTPNNAGIGSIYGYTIWVNNTSSTTQFHALADLGNVNSYDFYPPTTEDYRFNVSAINARGYSANSTTIVSHAVFPSPVAAPPLTATPGTGGPNVTLAWTAPTDMLGQNLQGYKIWRSASNADADYSLLVQLNNAANVSFTDAYVGNGGPALRYYKVQAVTDIRDGENSTAKDAMTKSLLEPPSSFNVSNTTAGKLRLTWVAPTPVAGSTQYGYKIDRSTDGSTWTQLVYLGLPLGPANLSFDDATASANTTYWYRIKSVSDVGDGNVSSTQGMRSMAVPWAPTISGSYNGITRLYTITITAPPYDGGGAITGYQIWRGTTSGGETSYSTSVLTTWSEIQTPSKTYYWIVKAVNAVGAGTASNELTLST